MSKPRGLATSVALVTVVVAVVAVLASGLVALGLLRTVTDSQARSRLAVEADAVTAAVRGSGAALPRRLAGAAALLHAQHVDVLLVGPGGRVRRAGGQVGDSVLTTADVAALADGRPVSAVRQLGDRRVFLEARPLPPDGVVALAQPVQESRGVTRLVLRRLLYALLAGLAVALVAGLVLARRLAAPLQQVAGAARALASGRRGGRLKVSGPSEVADVAVAVNQLDAALEAAERGQREFLLAVSHELRTPLTAVRGFAEALADDVVADESAPVTGAVILAEADRLERIVRDLLDLARLGAADFAVVLTPVDLDALLAEADSVWSARCASAGVELRLERQPALVVRTDADRVRQIIDNLAENALRATPAGAPLVLAVAAEPVGARIEVRDGGPGLTEQDVAVAFERFALHDRYRGVRRVGSGVGLALVAGLATRLGGRAEAGTAAEGGARFTVHLPRDGPPAR